MRRALLILALLALAACSRPLTTGERRFASDLFGPTLDTGAVRVAKDLGLFPPDSAPAAPAPRTRAGKVELRPGICDRTPQGPRTEPPPAFALHNRIHLVGRFYKPDTALGWPDRVILPEALIMAHELVHVWQWQNRALTRYRPARAVLESLLNLDPYFYDPGQDQGFLSFGYEQQGALMEDYFCYALFDPANPRRAEIRMLLAPHFPVGRIDAVLDR